MTGSAREEKKTQTFQAIYREVESVVWFHACCVHDMQKVKIIEALTSKYSFNETMLEAFENLMMRDFEVVHQNYMVLKDTHVEDFLDVKGAAAKTSSTSSSSRDLSPAYTVKYFFEDDLKRDQPSLNYF